MAGFAAVMTLLIDGLLSLLAAGLLSLCTFLYVRRRISAGPRRKRQLTAISLAPFLGLLWLVMALLLHVAISNGLAHQDCGFSPDPYVTLPNGYVLGSHNTYDGYFHAPGVETDVPVAGPGYVRSLVHLQLSEGVFTGTQYDFDTSSVRHFKFDTRTQTFQASPGQALTSGASQRSGSNDLDTWTAAETSAQQDEDSYWTMYAQYRHHWPNYVLVALVLAGEAAVCARTWKLWAMSKLLRET